MINKYKQANSYLNSFLNYEKKSFFPYKRSLNLERMYLLLKQLRVPYQRLKVIHIAGTKGKGSTAHFCAYLLAASGLKAGVFTSPHFFDFRERIKIVKKKQTGEIVENLISKADLVKIVEGLKRKTIELKLPENLGQVTFFEFFTALGFKYFLQKKVDFVILESGLGGRLDSTNVINPLVCIITHIGYDHMDKLGKKLSEITSEKAGIIKEGVPLICSSQRPESLRVIKNKCKSKDAMALFLNRDFKIKNLRVKRKYINFDFDSDNFSVKALEISLKGKCQAENASLAVAAVSLLEKRGIISKKINYKSGLKHCFLPGRFEIINKVPLTIVDIAHNVSSFSVLKESLKIYFPNKEIILIFSCSRDKDAGRMLKAIDYSWLILTSFNNPRSFSVLELKRIINEKSAYLADNVKEALRLAKDIYRKDCLIVVSGSIFLVSEAKRILQS